MGESVQNWCYKCRLIGIHETKVMDFAKAQGDEAAIEILQKVYKTNEHQRSNGLPQEPALRLWTKFSEAYVSGVGSRKREREEEAAQKAHMASVAASSARGYKVTKEGLRKQIAGMYDAGKISISEYEFGMIGSGFIRTLVGAAAGIITEDEQAIIDGYDEELDRAEVR